jgi:hypothetical protein
LPKKRAFTSVRGHGQKQEKRPTQGGEKDGIEAGRPPQGARQKAVVQKTETHHPTKQKPAGRKRRAGAAGAPGHAPAQGFAAAAGHPRAAAPS